MNDTPMTPEQEYEFYAKAENQEPQGPARRRHPPRPSPPVPVRIPQKLLDQARAQAAQGNVGLDVGGSLKGVGELLRKAHPMLYLSGRDHERGHAA